MCFLLKELSKAKILLSKDIFFYKNLSSCAFGFYFGILIFFTDVIPFWTLQCKMSNLIAHSTFDLHRLDLVLLRFWSIQSGLGGGVDGGWRAVDKGVEEREGVSCFCFCCQNKHTFAQFDPIQEVPH